MTIRAKLTSKTAIAILLALVLIADVGNLWATHDEVAAQAGQQHAYEAAQRQDQAAQKRESQMLVAKVCTGFGKLAAEEPPAGNPKTNPSRAYLQSEHATLVGIGADLGCGGSR